MCASAGTICFRWLRISARSCAASSWRCSATYDLADPAAKAALLLADGLIATHAARKPAEDQLVEAAERYEALPEPYQAARAWEAAETSRVVAGKRAGQWRRRAADIYQSLGAERSLANLLRAAKGSRSLSDYKISVSQERALSPGLTRREQEPAHLARQGDSTPVIAAALGVSVATVYKHIENIKRKLGASRKSDLVRLLSDR